MEFITLKTRKSGHQVVLKHANGDIKEVQKFRKTVMVWFGTSFKGVFSHLVIFEEGTVDHERYIQEMLLVALKFGNGMFDNNWTFQQDEGRSRINLKTQDWYRTYLSIFH